MLAEGNTVIEEWESQIYGADGTLYNNQYLWILTFENDTVTTMHEYNDTQHAALTFGPLGKWPELKPPTNPRSEEHTSELQSLMRISYAVFCLKKKKKKQRTQQYKYNTTT